jgi:hypothetical protein
MKTGNNKSTNNFIVRLWSPKYYNSNTKKVDFDGTITDVKNKESTHFHSAGDFLRKIELMQKKAEKDRK